MNSRIHWLVVYVAVVFAAFTVQAQPPATTSTLGVVMKVDVAARQIVLKTDAGAEVTVTMQPTASFRRTEPGETDLRNAGATWVDREVVVCRDGINTLVTSRKPDDLQAFCAAFVSAFAMAAAA